MWVSLVERGCIIANGDEAALREWKKNVARGRSSERLPQSTAYLRGILRFFGQNVTKRSPRPTWFPECWVEGKCGPPGIALQQRHSLLTKP